MGSYSVNVRGLGEPKQSYDYQELRAQQRAAEAQQLQLQRQQAEAKKAQQAERDMQLANRALNEAGGDYEKASMLFIKGGGSPAGFYAMRDQGWQEKQKKAEAKKSELGQQEQSAKNMAGLAQTVMSSKDPVAAHAALRQQLGDQIPENFDPTFWAGMKNYGDYAEKNARTAIAQHEQEIKDAAEKRAAELNSINLPSVKAEAEAKTSTAQKTLADPQGLNPQQRQQASQSAATLAETVSNNQRTSEDRKVDNDRQASMLRETSQHNRTMEGLDRQRMELTKKLEGGKLEQAAVKSIAETREGLNQLSRLRGIVDKGAANMGPIAGLANAPVIGSVAQMFGYTAGAELQADLDLAKQTIGKALEGGVLRKEDEEKYAKILPTIDDTPTVARYKIGQLEKKLSADLNTFMETQSKAGRRVPDVSGTPTVERWVRKDGKLVKQ